MSVGTSRLYWALLLVIALAMSAALGAPGAAAEDDSALTPAWSAWHRGDIDEAERLAQAHTDDPEGRHLLLLCDFVKGKYRDALREYKAVDPGYPRYHELAEPAAMSCFHLGRYDEALRLLKESGAMKQYQGPLAAMAKHPFKARLDRVAVIPFAGQEMTDYFPDFDARINGQDVIAHVDTGGAFIYMGPQRARKLKIKASGGGLGSFHGWMLPIGYSFGIADSMTIGPVSFENVPVAVVPSLIGPQDFIIFGTCVLEPFLSTLDYPNRRLILSPRDNPELHERHLAMLTGEPVRVPFYLWGDHYMFARGGVGETRDLNFFIDTGLVTFLKDKGGQKRQAAFMARKSDLTRWGIAPDLVRKKLFEIPLPVSLGPLEQSAQIVKAKRRAAISSLGGVRIDGLLSHAFLKNYCWTIDFDAMEYSFRER